MEEAATCFKKMFAKASGFASEKPQWAAVLGAVFLVGLLQLLRPFYFLTDDNLTGFMPFLKEVLNRLARAENIFVNPYLFGGWNFSRDPGALGALNPWVLLLVVFPDSIRTLISTEWSALGSLMLGSWAFVQMAKALGKTYGVPPSPGAWIFFSLSWNFALFPLVVGPNWVVFLASQAAIPLLFWGAVERNARRSFLLILAGAGYSLFCGHLHPFLTSALFLSFFVLLLAVLEKRWSLLIRWGSAFAVYGCLLAPWLISAFHGVAQSPRQLEVTLGNAREMNFPLAIQMGSLLGGPFMSLTRLPMNYFQLNSAYTLSIAFSAASFVLGWILFRYSLRWKKACAFFFIFAAILWFTPKREILPFLPFIALALFGLTGIFIKPGISSLEKICIGIIPFLIVWLDRPQWLAVVMSHIPVYSSLRWPFREILLLTFFLHIIVLFNWSFLSGSSRRFFAWAGIVVLIAFVLVQGAPSFNRMENDRKLVINGEGGQWWKQIEEESGGAGPWIFLMDKDLFYKHAYEIPFSLAGAYNYPAFFKVRSLSGYYGSWMNLNEMWGNKIPYHWSGVFSPEDGKELCLNNPDLCFVEIAEAEEGYLSVTAHSPKTGQKWVVRMKSDDGTLGAIEKR